MSLVLLSMAEQSRQPNSPALPLVVLHGPVPAPVLIDGGLPGGSAGVQRFFYFPGITNTGIPVQIDWLMSTTSATARMGGEERRISDAVFSFGGNERNQIILNGLATYPGENDTLQPDAIAIRAMTGGTGRYAGSSGQIVSERFEDGSWNHSFLFGDYDIIIGKDGNDIIEASAISESCMAGLGGADIFRFNQRRDQFRGQIDLITDFNAAEGDVIQITEEAFSGLEKIRFKAISSTQQLNKEAKRSSTVVFDQSTGFLWADTNGKSAGWGEFGGPFVALIPNPQLSVSGVDIII